MAEIGGVLGPRKVWFCRVMYQAAKQQIDGPASGRRLEREGHWDES